MSYARYLRLFTTMILAVGLVLISPANQLAAISPVKVNRPDWMKLAAKTVPNAPSTSAAPDQTAKKKANEDFGKLPLSFEANQGQTDSHVKFLARGGNYTLFLTPVDAVLKLYEPRAKKSLQKRDEPKTSKFTVLRMSLVGANPAPRMEGVNQLAGISNYFIGNDSSKWRTNVPHYSKVQYKDVYPGVDLVYYGKQRQLEYDLVLAPGADPSVVTLAFKGARRMNVDTNGDLVLHTRRGELRHAKPFIYQEANGVKQMIAGRYVLKGKHKVGFAVGAYDRNRELVFDPTLSYSTFLGGSDEDYGNAITLGGGAIVTGSTKDATTDFPKTTGAYDETINGGTDAFVTKLSSDGSSLSFSTFLGASGTDEGNGVGVDNNSNIYVVGSTTSSGFPTTMGAYDTTHNGQSDVFVVKFNSTGTTLSYSTFIGGSSYDYGYGITVNSFAEASVTGETHSSGFPTILADDTTLGGLQDAFVAKVSSTGATLVFSTFLGGSSSDTGRAIDRGFVTGYTSSSNFPVPSGVDTSLGGSSDAFVVQIGLTSPTTYGPIYGTYLGGDGDDKGYGIALDSSSTPRPYVTGFTDGGTTDPFPTTGSAYDTTYNGGVYDAFVTRFANNLSTRDYSTFIGSSGDDYGLAIAVGSSDNVYITGYTTDGSTTHFPTASALYGSFQGGGIDAFVSKFNSTLSTLSFSTFIGGNDDDAGQGIVVSGSDAYVTGYTWDTSTDFPTTMSAYDQSHNGVTDVFVCKIST